MSDTAIHVENISKLYQLGEISTGTLSKDMHRWWAKFRGQEDPFKKVGQVNDRTKKSDGDIVWALKDISFDVKQGEVLGIIGNNGAGKSTLLKILSRVTKPTSGRIRVKGRIASLLEVGTGFHQELTGRENIFLNGAIMGMKKAEIRSKMDEIISFSGVERYLDTPVKRYSSGMYVRLAFAVAAHLDPEILVIDEVLAVGDAEFQKKCLGKMKDVGEKEGRTVLFVSHNMTAVQKLCTKGILLSKGENIMSGKIDTVIDKYLSENFDYHSIFRLDAELNPFSELPVYARQLSIEDLEGNPMSEIPLWDPWKIRISFIVTRPTNQFVIGLGLVSQQGTPIHTSWSIPMDLKMGEFEAVFTNTEIFLNSGVYFLCVGLSKAGKSIQYLDQVASIKVSELPSSNSKITIPQTTGIYINQMPVTIANIPSISTVL